MKLRELLGLAKVEFDKHSPEILTGIGIAGMFAAVIFSIQATPKAVKAVEEKKKGLNKEKLTVGETIGATWKYYIPTAITLAGSTACVIGANSVNARRNAALAAAYSLSETALTEYQAKVKEVVGERKENDIRSEVSRDRVAADPPKSSEIVFVGNGNQLFQEEITGRYFRSDMEKVRRAELELCRMMKDDLDEQVSVNDVLTMLGLTPSGKINNDLVWRMSDGYIQFRYDFVPVGDEVCTVISYTRDPKSRYDY